MEIPPVAVAGAPEAYPLVTSPATESGDNLSSTLVTVEQQAAISALKEFDQDTVFAWLIFARSIEHVFHHRSAPGGLSAQQLHAISTLRDCDDRNIIDWMRNVALAENVNLPTEIGRSASKSSIGASSWLNPRLSKSTPRSSAGSYSLSTYSNGTSYSTPRSSLGYASSLPDLPEVAFENEVHTHWCPECDKMIESCDGWKRHMKEHETYFPCMPTGPVVDLGDGPRCALCNEPRPCHNHLSAHHVSQCVSKAKHPTRKSRKALLVQHLAVHGVLDPMASALAEKWQCTRRRQVFSCGFCVRPFVSITDQLNHIDNEHFKIGQRKSSWDISTVIKGLLHQTKVQKYWKRLMTSGLPYIEYHIYWESPGAEKLQCDLEAGDHSGADLALMAFMTGNYRDANSSHQLSTAVSTNLLRQLLSEPLPKQSHCASGPGGKSIISGSHSVSDPRQPPALVSRYHLETLPWSDTSNLYTDSHHFQPSIPEHHPPSGNAFGDPLGNRGDIPLDDSILLENNDVPLDTWKSLEMLPAEFFSPQGFSFDQHALPHGVLDDSRDSSSAQSISASQFKTENIQVVNTSPLTQRLPFSNATSEHNQPISVVHSRHHGLPHRNTSPKSSEKPLPALPGALNQSIQSAKDAQPRSPNDMDIS